MNRAPAVQARNTNTVTDKPNNRFKTEKKGPKGPFCFFTDKFLRDTEFTQIRF